MGFNDVLIIFNYFLLTWEYCVHPYLRKAFQGIEDSLTSSTICWTTWTAVPTGTRSSACLQKGLLLAAALCYCFVPSYSPHQSASTVICASSPRITADKASWEAQISSFSKPDWFCRQEIWECSATLLCRQRTGRGETGMDRDRHRDQPLTPAAGSVSWSLEVALHLVSSNLQKHTPASSDWLPGVPQLQARPWLCRRIFQTLFDKSTNTPALLIGKKRCSLQCWCCYNLKERYLFFPLDLPSPGYF